VSISTNWRRRVSRVLGARICASGKGPQVRTHSLRKLGAGSDIHGIGFRQLLGGLRKIAGLARIDDNDRQRCRGQGTGHQHLQAPCGIQHNQHRSQRVQSGHQRGEAWLIIRHRLSLGARPLGHSQLRWGNIHADK
jgi:hypothetical protein